MKIYIKNMVCTRCKLAVISALEKYSIPYESIELGEVETSENIPPALLVQLDNCLRQSGLEIIESRKDRLVEKIKTTIIELVNYSEETLKVNLSYYISERMNYDYSYLSNLFSEAQGVSIEKYFINLKIERVKELLLYNEHNIKEISFMTRYSSVAHLSNQFKKTTGMAPSQFRELLHKNRLSLEQVSCA
jgi:AraC-like DNA-binding protein